jgi:hypothetical protein
MFEIDIVSSFYRTSASTSSNYSKDPCHKNWRRNGDGDLAVMHSSLEELLLQRISLICQAGIMMPSYDPGSSGVEIVVNNVQRREVADRSGVEELIKFSIIRHSPLVAITRRKNLPMENLAIISYSHISYI